MNNTVIEKEIRNLGITANLQGYYYLQEAIKLVLKDNFIQMKMIYIELAKIFDKKASVIERNIRYAINFAFNDNTSKAIEKYNFDVSKKTGLPTSSQFVKGMAREVRNKVNECD